MADTSQVGSGIGSALGFFLGIREGDRRRKKSKELKARLTEKELQEKERKEARKARLKLLLEGVLVPEQQQGVLSEFGIPSTAKQNILDTISREGFANSDEARIFREEQERKAELDSLRRFGITGAAAVRAGGTGAADIPGLSQTPESIANVGLTEAKTKTQETLQSFNLARTIAQKALTGARNRNNSIKGTGSNKISALKSVQGALLREIQILDKAVKDDLSGILGVADPEIEQMKQRRAELTNELVEVRKELRKIGGVKETDKPNNGSKVNRLTTLKTMRRKNLINDTSFSNQVKELFSRNKITPDEALEALTK